MNTNLKTIAAALLLTAGTSTVQASESANRSLMMEPAYEVLALENWMLEKGHFDAAGQKATAETVVEIAAGNPDFSILVEAVTKAGLAEALSAEGPFTVFAPTNEAFEAFFSKIGVSGVNELTAEQLIPVLTYHVVPGKVMSGDLTETTAGTLNEGKNVTIDLSEGVKINESNVIKADIEGSNGVIHVIDAVLIPE